MAIKGSLSEAFLCLPALYNRVIDPADEWLTRSQEVSINRLPIHPVVIKQLASALPCLVLFRTIFVLTFGTAPQRLPIGHCAQSVVVESVAENTRSPSHWNHFIAGLPGKGDFLY